MQKRNVDFHEILIREDSHVKLFRKLTAWPGFDFVGCKWPHNNAAGNMTQSNMPNLHVVLCQRNFCTENLSTRSIGRGH